MRKVKITLTLSISEKVYQEEMMEVKNDILSGKYQREIMKDTEGVEKVKATFEELKS